MQTDRTTYTNGNGIHAYDVGTSNGTTFTVYATNRDQAARRVERDGHTVSWVNMVG